MKHIFPEINFDRLKAEVLGWARQFPFIRRVNFYQHRGGKFNTDKRYLIDIVVHNETPRKEIAYLETETEDIGGSSFFEGLMHAKSGEGFDRNNWEIYVRQQLDGPPIFTVGENSVLFDRPENLDFPRLNIDVLKNIANRWVKKYKNQHSIDIFSVRLFHYASDWQAEVARSMGINNGIIRVKYAIVLSVDKQNEEDMATDTKFYCTTSEIPTSFIYGNFEDVYSASVPKNWMREWAFIQHTCQAPLPNQVRVDEGCVVLYPQITQEERQHSKHTEKNDPQAWTFRCIGAQWQITFEGQTYSIKNNKSISYILPLIKQPGVPFGYVELCQIVEVVNIEDAPKKEKKKKEAGDLSQDGPVYEGGLREQASIKRYKEEEIQEMKDALAKVYQEYLKDPDKHKDNWPKAKNIAETQYGICTNERNGKLFFSKSKYQRNDDDPNIIRAGKSVSTNKNRFLNEVKNSPSSEKLYQHFEQSLKSKGGYIKYTPPEGSPLWEIIN